MVNRGPLVTLLAVLGLVLVLLVVDHSTQPEPADRSAESSAAPSTTATPPTATPTTTTSAPTTPPPVAPFPTQAVYVGRTSGGEASVAVAVKGDKAVAYVCDGQALEAWLQGSAANGALSLQRSDGGRLTGSLVGGQLAGTLAVGPRTSSFTAASVEAPAGLYRANASNGRLLDRIGWIVRRDGSYVGLRNRGGSVQPAPTFDASATTVVIDGSRVPVEQVVGDSGAG